jgi:uncharacterized protein (DUF983 family)
MKRVLLLFARAIRLHCPNCGGGSIYGSWFKLKPTCPTCGLRLEREEGAFLGAITINLVATELLCALMLLALIVAFWPAVPWDLMQWGLVGLNILFPILFFRHSKTIWLALDLAFRPATKQEIVSRGDQNRG